MNARYRTATRLWLATAWILLLGGCAGLPDLARRHPPVEYLLVPAMPAAVASGARCPVLLVNSPDAAPGFDSDRMYYMRKPLKLEYYARHRWADTPAHMLHPLLVEAAETSGLFGAVISHPAPVRAGLRLDSELLGVTQIFEQGTSKSRLRLRVELFAPSRRQVVASRIFEFTEPAPSNDPYGDAVATNRAVGRLLQGVTEFLKNHAGSCPGGRSARRHLDHHRGIR
jgi:cholesterol transport system auxiliary component